VAATCASVDVPIVKYNRLAIFFQPLGCHLWPFFFNPSAANFGQKLCFWTVLLKTTQNLKTKFKRKWSRITFVAHNGTSRVRLRFVSNLRVLKGMMAKNEFQDKN